MEPRKAPERPDDGQPCNGCGFCCAAELCDGAVMALGDVPAPCPLMTYHDGRFWCRLVETEKQAGMEPLIAKALGIGTGCAV